VRTRGFCVGCGTGQLREAGLRAGMGTELRAGPGVPDLGVPGQRLPRPQAHGTGHRRIRPPGGSASTFGQGWAGRGRRAGPATAPTRQPARGGRRRPQKKNNPGGDGAGSDCRRLAAGGGGPQRQGTGRAGGQGGRGAQEGGLPRGAGPGPGKYGGGRAGSGPRGVTTPEPWPDSPTAAGAWPNRPGAKAKGRGLGTRRPWLGPRELGEQPTAASPKTDVGWA